MKPKFKLTMPKVEYQVKKVSPSEFHILRIIIHPTIKQRVTTKLTVCSTLEEALQYIADYKEKERKWWEEQNYNEIKESYTGFEGDR